MGFNYRAFASLAIVGAGLFYQASHMRKVGPAHMRKAHTRRAVVTPIDATQSTAARL